jgi:tRNA-Thr(GGU) m(6)t(6)A37 methyltransferase TsaA
MTTLEWQPIRPDVAHGVHGKTILDEGVKVVLTRVVPGGAFAAHRDAYGHAFYFLSGEGLVTVGERRFAVQPGQVVRVAAGEVHAYENTGPADLLLISLNVPAPPQEAGRLPDTEVTYRPIGVIHSPFHNPRDMPIQPTGAASAEGTAEVWPEFAAGLQDLEGFSHVILIYHFHQAGPARMTVTPFLDVEPHGVFATRAPIRPNPIGLSIVRLLDLAGNVLRLGDVDVLDGTPLLDIKPYVADFDRPRRSRTGWLERAHGQVRTKRSDDRFHP